MQEEEEPPPSDQLAAAPITVRLPRGSSAGNGGFDELITVESEGGGGSPAGNRWPRQETMALLKIRSDMDPLFQEATPKAPLWEEVSRKLREEGYQRSAKKCKEKFENVFKYYKRTKEARAGKSYRFFSQLEALRPSSSAATAVAETAAAHAPPPPILSSSANMVNIEASSSGATAPSQHNLFSINVPALLPAAAAPIAIPKIAPPPTDATDGPSFSSNTSSYSGTESEDEEEGETIRKRKRKLRGGGGEAPEESGKMMAFFEGLIQKVMDQQEKMLQRFLEAIERREQNRMIREEAWRRQEKSRLSREHELAAQERVAAASRDDAIISFLQKLTGQKIPIPPRPQPPPITIVPAEETPTSPPPSPPPPMPPEVPDKPPKETNLGSSSRTTTEPILSSRWPKSEVHALIKLRSGMESRYQESIPKGPLWEEISAGMLRLGYNRSAKRCKEKWENINKYFKKVKESNKNRREDAKTCPYFHELEALYRKKIPGGSSSGGTAAQTLSTGDHLPIISPSTASKQQEDRFGFFEQGSSSVSPVKKPEDIVKKMMGLAFVEPESEKKEEDSSFQFSIQCMMPGVLYGRTRQNNFLAVVR